MTLAEVEQLLVPLRQAAQFIRRVGQPCAAMLSVLQPALTANQCRLLMLNHAKQTGTVTGVVVRPQRAVMAAARIDRPAAVGHVVFQQTPLGDPRGTARAATVSAVTRPASDETAPDTAQFRNALTDHIARLGTFKTPKVEAAFRTVPRHLFLPGTSVQDAYAPRVVVTKRAADGAAISSASSPNVVAAMLEQLDARPGHRILEIGTGTGINAALLAELAGPGGHVTTIDIDGDIVEGARRSLDAAGYRRNVTVVCADGADGHPGGAPYDRIIATAGAWDLPPAWWQQLAPGGRLVVPIRLHGSGLTRSLAFDYATPGQLIISSSAQVCGFVPMRGTTAAEGSPSIRLTGDMTLNLDGSDAADHDELAQALTYPRAPALDQHHSRRPGTRRAP